MLFVVLAKWVYAKLFFSFFFCRFNGLNFLKGHKGKKIMFVGDSLSLNQFNSLACMIHAAVPNSRTTFRQRDALQSVTFEVGSFLFLLCLLSIIVFKPY
jgi:hypothetical protein